MEGVFGIGIQELTTWAVALLILIIALREVLCWYWKINRIVGLLEEVRTSLALIAENRVKTPGQSSPQMPSS